MEVVYIDHLGSDDRVVDAARVSFSKLSSNYTGEQNAKLIKYLASHNHWTPFAHCIITLKERVPIFVARQRFKHTVGLAYNEVSRRYVDDTPELYYPELWRRRPDGSVKQGSGTGEVTHLKYQMDVTSTTNTIPTSFYYEDLMEQCLFTYNLMIKNGVAPEQARMVLPQSMYTEYFVTGSLAAFARAYTLRSDDHAQLEIQELAKQWDTIIRPLYPVSWSALVD